ncbi:MAG: DUF3662 domain-containing protein [Chloroflexota bacterium]|nr:DUF3662 domain-containing protein [Chloroflexota bacterium]
MAGPLAAIERFFERFLERPAARLFQARLEPIHLQRELERSMEAHRRYQDRRTYVPSGYRVLLHPADLLSFEPDLEALSDELAAALHTHARQRGYTLSARPRVQLEASRAVGAGEIVVRATAVETEAERAAPSRGEGEPDVARHDPVATQDEPRSSASGTSVYAAPQANLPNAVLSIRIPGHQLWRVPVRSATLRVGRALDNDLVLPDERVSRHHGQLAVRFGTLVYTDLGSTNGSYLNGSAVTEIALGPGDVLQLGSSTLAIEHGD